MRPPTVLGDAPETAGSPWLLPQPKHVTQDEPED